MKKFIILVLFLILSAGIFKAQINSFIVDVAETTIAKNHQPLFNKARLSFENDLFLEALPPLDSLLKLYPDNVPVIYLTAICRTYNEESKGTSIALFKKIEKNKAQLEYFSYHIGYAYEQNDSIKMADKYFVSFITEESAKTRPNKQLVDQAARRIANLKMLDAIKTKVNVADIKNIGAPVNTEASEYGPLIPSDESFMVYTYRGKLSKGGKQNLKKTKMEGPAKRKAFILRMCFQAIK